MLEDIFSKNTILMFIRKLENIYRRRYFSTSL